MPGVQQTTSRDFLEQLTVAAVDEISVIARAMCAALKDSNRLVYGDIELSREERVMSALHDAAPAGPGRPSPFDVMRVLAPAQYRRDIAQLRSDLRALGLLDAPGVPELLEETPELSEAIEVA